MKTIFVSKNGIITSIKKALELIRDNEEATILLDEGIYFEKIHIYNDNIIIKGNCKEKTFIIFNDFSRKIHHDGFLYNTFRTGVVFIHGNNVRIENVTIENSSGISEIFGQAVALQITGDKAKIINCNIKSYQDTIFIGPYPDNLKERYKGFIPEKELNTSNLARHFFDRCNVYGDIDFIFGGGNSVFNKCNIISNGKKGYVCAPSTRKEQKYGITFIDCNFSSIDKDAKIYLARPWRDYGMCSFINCFFEDIFKEEIFNKWDNTDRDKTCRFFYYNLDGNINKSKICSFAKELSKEEVLDYNIKDIFNGWNPLD